MDCDVAQEALSARIDGEREPVPAARVDEHLATCEDCRTWYAQAVDQTQQLRRLAGRSQVAAVAAASDRPAVSLASRRLPSRRTWLRWTLALVGLLQVALAVAQAAGINVGTSAALGVIMVVAAARPATAAGLAGVLLVFTAILTAYLVLPDNASRGRRRGHLYPTDGSAA